MSETERTPIHIVVDTDAGCEIDDQFALAYLLANAGEHDIHIDAIHAAPFREGLAKDPSVCEPLVFEEISRILRLAGAAEIPVKHGATRYLWQRESGEDAHTDCRYDDGPWMREDFVPMPVRSDAAQNLIALTKQHTPEDPLRVVCIGVLTNIASALLTEPVIEKNLRLIYLGGGGAEEDTRNEFNVAQDLFAFARIRQARNALRFPCTGCCDALGIPIRELSERLRDIGGPLCEYLAEINEKRLELRRTREKNPEKTVLWDVAPVAYLLHPEWFRLSPDGREVEKLDGEAILEDMFASLRRMTDGRI